MGQNTSIINSFSAPRRRIYPSLQEDWRVTDSTPQPPGDPSKWINWVEKTGDKIAKDWGVDKVDKWVEKVAKDGYDDLLDDVDVLEQSWEDIEAVMNKALDDLDDDLQEYWHDIESGFDSFDEWLKDISRLAEDLGLELYETNLGIVLELPLTNFFGMVIYGIQWVLTEITGENFLCDQAHISKRNICNGCPDGSFDCSDINAKVDGFCSLYGPGGDSLCNSQCKVWSSEWSKDQRVDECNYNPCDNVTQMKGGCCGVCCPLPGEGCRCKRTAYKGDPLTCCLTDMKCFIPEDDSLANPKNSQQPECFTDTLPDDDTTQSNSK